MNIHSGPKTFQALEATIVLLINHRFLGRLKFQDRKMQDWKMTDKFAGVENAGLEIDGQKLQVVENDGHSIKR